MLIKRLLHRSKEISKPKKFCALFILTHWTVLFPIMYIIDGEPPLPLMTLILPTLAVLPLIDKIFPGVPDNVFWLHLVVVQTVSYGVIGYLIGLLYSWLEERKRR